MGKKLSQQKKYQNRPIGELITVLGEDFEYLAERMYTWAKRGTITNRDLTHARNLVRCLFALVEGVTFSIKLEALEKYFKEGRHDIRGIVELVFEERYDVDDKGGITIRPIRITTDKNVKLAFRLYSEIYGISNLLNTGSKWWAALRRSNNVRDRLMHPRDPQDLDISPQEILDAIEAENGFRDLVWKTLEAKKAKLKQNT